MAATTKPILWDFYEVYSETSSLGGLIHYHDTTAQKIYVNNGIKTKVTTIVNGRWNGTIYENEIVLNEDAYNSISCDQTTNNEFHMVGNIGNDLYFLRYNGKVLIDVHDFLEQDM